MTQRMVQCKKLGRLLPGLAKPPFPGPLGELIYSNISQEAWLSWQNDVELKVLNEYRLNMADPNDHQVMLEQMLLFLNLKRHESTEVKNQDLGRGKE